MDKKYVFVDSKDIIDGTITVKDMVKLCREAKTDAIKLRNSVLFSQGPNSILHVQICMELLKADISTQDDEEDPNSIYVNLRKREKQKLNAPGAKFEDFDKSKLNISKN